MSNKNLENVISISLETQQKLASCIRKRNDSIELPKRTDPTQQKLTSYDCKKNDSMLWLTLFYQKTTDLI